MDSGRDNSEWKGDRWKVLGQMHETSGYGAGYSWRHRGDEDVKTPQGLPDHPGGCLPQLRLSKGPDWRSDNSHIAEKF